MPDCQSDPRSKILTVDQLAPVTVRWKEAGRTVVWTNGCFDLLHVGHVRSLREARLLGDVLIVGLNSDRSVRELKGPTRPLVAQADRAEVLASLACVDAVVIFDERTPEATISRLQPAICCKGGDYAPPHGKPALEAALVESYGGRMAYLSFSEGISTTELARRAAAAKVDLGRAPLPRRAVFLDRDGTIVEDTHYPSDPAKLRLLPGVVSALKALRAAGFALVVISNQSGVGRGYFSRDDADRVHQGFVELLRKEGIELDGSYYCYHHPDEGCDCRKPAPKMLREAAGAMGLDLSRSFMIGDKMLDVQAGQAAGVRTVFFADQPASEGRPADLVTHDWSVAAAFFLGQTSERP